MNEIESENLIMRGVLQGRNQIDITIENNEKRVTQTGDSVHPVLLEQIDSRFLRDHESTSVQVGRE